MKSLSERTTLFVPADGSVIKGCVQIVHGMAEHQKRYIPVAEFLKSNGFVVVTSDLRGHGDNVETDADLGYFGGVSELVADVKEVFDWLKAKYPDRPMVLLGHSMGTLISTSFFKDYADEIDALFLSGMPGKNAAAGMGKFLTKLIAAFKGDRHRSKLIAGMVNGPFAKAFPNDDPLAWLSVDTENVARYHADPKCGYMFTLKGYHTLMDLLLTTYGKKPFVGTKKEMPICLMSGAEDPCRVSDKVFMESAANFKNAGYTNVTFELISDQRHEIFNDTKREETLQKLLAFLETAVR